MTVYVITHFKKKEFQGVKIYEKHEDAKLYLVNIWQDVRMTYFLSDNQVDRIHRGRTVESWILSEQETI